jgi:RND family efflux transporter MFP subunit
MTRMKPSLRNGAVLGLLALAGCSNETKVIPQATEVVRGVATSVAKTSEVADYLDVPGTVRAIQTSDVASQIMGNITQIQVHEGDRVGRGQVLAMIDQAQPRAGVDQANAAAMAAAKDVAVADSQYGLAETTLRRYQQLYDKKSVSPQEYDEVKARLEAARARREATSANRDQAAAAVKQAQTVLGYTAIRAPFAGVIAAKKVDAGTLAAPGMALFTIEDTARFQLEAPVDESNLAALQKHKAVTVILDALSRAELKGMVSEITPAADPASRSFLIKIDLPADSRLHSGLFGRALIPRGVRKALLIPSSAIVDRGQLLGVFVLSDTGMAQLRYITLGTHRGDAVEVLSGLQEGERFVQAPGTRDLSGKQISTQP